jgi:MFS family permease
MPQSPYRWVIVAAGGFVGCVAIGAMFCLPVFLVPLTAATGWSRTGVSSAMTIGFLTMAASGLGWGLLVDRFGPRTIVAIGAILLSAGLALASRATSLIGFQLWFGALVGVSVSALLPPLMATVTRWFETQRSLAVSLVSAGFGMAPMTMSPLAAWLIGRMDWRSAMLVISGLVLALILPAAFFLREAPARREPARPGADTAKSDGREGAMTTSAALRSTPFLILAATNFCCCAAHSGPIFHTVSYAIACGVAPLAAVSIYSLEGLAGMGGRLAFGVLGDRLGAKKVLVAGLLVQAVGALGYLIVGSLDQFYLVAALFGFTYAGVMPLYAVLARENFPARMMGAIIGGTSTAGSLGMALGPLAGGWIYDTFATYAWLYLGSFGIGFGAFLIAMTFRPFAKLEPAPIPRLA